MTTDRWLLDQTIDLLELGNAMGWDRTKCVDALVARRIDRADAGAFFAFAHAEHSWPDSGAETELSHYQWARLRVV